MIVTDTNVLARFIMSDDAAVDRLAEIDRDWVAPPLWRSEFRSALAGYARIEGLSLEVAIEAYEKAAAIVTEQPVDTAAVLRLVSASPCTAYALEFIALAQRLEVPLVTLDRQLLSEFPGLAMSPQSFGDGDAEVS